MSDHALEGLIVVAGRTFVPRRKAGRPRAGTTPLFHAVAPRCRMALCATEPGAGSGWADSEEARITCPACLRRLARLEAN